MQKIPILEKKLEAVLGRLNQWLLQRDEQEQGLQAATDDLSILDRAKQWLQRTKEQVQGGQVAGKDLLLILFNRTVGEKQAHRSHSSTRTILESEIIFTSYVGGQSRSSMPASNAR